MSRTRLASAVLAAALLGTACTSPSSDPGTTDPEPESTTAPESSDGGEEVDDEQATGQDEFDSALCDDLTLALDVNGTLSEQTDRLDAAGRLADAYPQTNFAAWADAWAPIVNDGFSPEALEAYGAAIASLVDQPIGATIATNAADGCGLDETQTMLLSGGPSAGFEDSTETLVEPSLEYLYGAFGGAPDNTTGVVTLCDEVGPDKFDAEQSAVEGEARPFGWYVVCFPNIETNRFGFGLLRGHPGTASDALVSQLTNTPGALVEATPELQDFTGAPLVGGQAYYDADTATTLLAWHASVEGRESFESADGSELKEPVDPVTTLFQLTQ